MKELEKLVQEMSLREQLGQMFFWSHVDSDPEDGIRTLQPGGLVLFSEDFRDLSRQQVLEKLSRAQACAKQPLLIAVDEEGGTVVRVSRQPALRETRFLSPMDIKQAGGLDAVCADAQEKSRFLREFGISVNFAPVVDLCQNPEAFIYPRVYGGGAAETAEYAAAVSQVMSREHMGSSLKHFPGYSDNRDTHKDLAVDSRPLEQFEQEDLLPFRAGISGGADSIMISHTIVRCFDEQQPASLSPRVHGYIREEMGFDGVLMTDDLNMQAIVKHCAGEDPCVQALAAGNDMLLIQDVTSGLNAAEQAVRDGKLCPRQIEGSVLRILRWKGKLGLL